jgi:uncharacterized membrane protein
MESRAKLLGHPIHQMLIVFPLGLLGMAVIFDLLAMALAASFAGFGLALVTGWLGGELVDRLAIGVNDGAHVDAPSSLTTRRVRG